MRYIFVLWVFTPGFSTKGFLSYLYLHSSSVYSLMSKLLVLNFVSVRRLNIKNRQVSVSYLNTVAFSVFPLHAILTSREDFHNRHGLKHYFVHLNKPSSSRSGPKFCSISVTKTKHIHLYYESALFASQNHRIRHID